MLSPELGRGDFHKVGLASFPSLLAVPFDPRVVSTRFMAKKILNTRAFQSFGKAREFLPQG